jgi:hypothetical protein
MLGYTASRSLRFPAKCRDGYKVCVRLIDALRRAAGFSQRRVYEKEL